MIVATHLLQITLDTLGHSDFSIIPPLEKDLHKKNEKRKKNSYL